MDTSLNFKLFMFQLRKSNLKCYSKLTINDEQLTMKDKTEVSVYLNQFL